MSQIQVKVNYEGVSALLNSQEMADICTEVATQVCDRAGDGYAVAEPHLTGQRVAVNVYPATKEAEADNYENNTLLRALGR